MRLKMLVTIAALIGSLMAAEIPRKSPEFTVQLPDGKEATVSSYRGKVLCLVFILTTWPTCQRTTQVLSGIQKELGPKGFAVLAGAVNDNPDIPGFMQKFAPAFPVGTANGPAVLQYMQWPAGQRPLVPFVAFIDRKGTIRAQFSGADGDFFGTQEEQNIREQVEKLLSESILTKPREQKH